MDRSLSFLIRIWDDAEEGDPNAPLWRGSVENIHTGNRLYFEDLRAILRFIEEETGMEGGSRRRWPRGPVKRGKGEQD